VLLWRRFVDRAQVQRSAIRSSAIMLFSTVDYLYSMYRYGELDLLLLVAVGAYAIQYRTVQSIMDMMLLCREAVVVWI
jgi:hypothetical protein